MSEDLQWRARIFADKTLKSEVQKEIAKLALVVLGNHKLKVDYSEEGFDRYTYCKHSTKQFCPVGSKTTHYKGSWKNYTVFGHTRTDVYLEVLRLLANDSSVYYPIVAPRTDGEWIEVEEYKKLNEQFENLKEQISSGLECAKKYIAVEKE